MASLICHGNLNDPGPPLSTRLYPGGGGGAGSSGSAGLNGSAAQGNQGSSAIETGCWKHSRAPGTSRMILEAYHPAPVRLFSSVDRQITLSFVLDYPTPAVASRVKTTRMAGFLARHHYTGRVPAQVLAEWTRANLLTASARHRRRRELLSAELHPTSAATQQPTRRLLRWYRSDYQRTSRCTDLR